MDASLFVMPALCAVADRLWGSDFGFKGKKAVILLALLAGGFWLGQLSGLCWGPLWLAYRSLPFFAGSGAPQNFGERLACVFRHGIIVPPALFIGQQFDLDMLHVGLAFGAYAIGAVLLAWVYGWLTKMHIADGEAGGHENVFVEIIRGALYGAAVTAVYAAPWPIAI